MNIEEAYNTIKKSVEAINTRPYATKAEYEKVECIKVLLTAYEEKCKELKKEIQDDLDVRNRWGLTLQELEKEKEKNKELKWKPIKDYDRKKYDWVLVKYFDGDYECVPEVAEKRSDGKWYTSERQIPFEVKYFFDMQEILKEE